VGERTVGAGAAEAALVNRVLSKTPPISPKKINALMVDPTRISGRLVIRFPSVHDPSTTQGKRPVVSKVIRNL